MHFYCTTSGYYAEVEADFPIMTYFDVSGSCLKLIWLMSHLRYHGFYI